MRITFVASYDSTNERDVDALGEALRNEFFNQDKGEFGCYSTFELRDGVFQETKFIEGIDEEEDSWYEIAWTSAKKYVSDTLVEMRYYWDGDGYLSFHFLDGTAIANSDCKKSHGWYLQGVENN
jgi:hypothetical protein